MKKKFPQSVSKVFTFRRTISLFVVTTLILSNHFAFAASGVLLPAANASSKKFPIDLNAIQIPEQIGKIQETYRGKEKETVILVQDAHAIPDAQRSIQKIIDFFQKQYGFNLIAVEGASEELDPQIFRSFPDKKILTQVFNQYFDKGELTGTVASAIFNESASLYQGVENWPLYQEGLSFYLKALENQETILQKIEEFKKELQSQKEQVYSEKLLELDRALADFHANHGGLMDLLKKLAETRAPEKGTELALLFDEIQGQGKDKSYLASEVKVLAEKVKTLLESKRLNTAFFNQKLQEFQTSQISPETFALSLQELTAKENLPVQFSDTLTAVIQNQKQMRDIEGTQLFRDLENYTQSVKENIFRNEQEKNLDKQSRELELLEKLTRLELGYEDWAALKSLLKTNDSQYASQLLNGLKFNLGFYWNAEKRDEILFENFTTLMRERKSNSALMVAGGFHTEGITQRLKAKGLSYVLLTPHMNSVPENSHYREHMSGKVSWMDYFQVENGRVDLYKAFVRASRDKLLKADKAILKRWRDQIVKDLAQKGQITKTSQYVSFMDEVNDGKIEFRPKWQIDVEHFLQSLRHLEANKQLTEQNILKLLQPATLTELAGGPGGTLQRGGVPSNLIPAVSLGVIELPDATQRRLDEEFIRLFGGLTDPVHGRSEMRGNKTRSRDDKRIRDAHARISAMNNSVVTKKAVTKLAELLTVKNQMLRPDKKQLWSISEYGLTIGEQFQFGSKEFTTGYTSEDFVGKPSFRQLQEKGIFDFTKIQDHIVLWTTSNVEASSGWNSDGPDYYYTRTTWTPWVMTRADFIEWISEQLQNKFDETVQFVQAVTNKIEDELREAENERQKYKERLTEQFTDPFKEDQDPIDFWRNKIGAARGLEEITALSTSRVVKVLIEALGESEKRLQALTSGNNYLRDVNRSRVESEFVHDIMDMMAEYGTKAKSALPSLKRLQKFKFTVYELLGLSGKIRNVPLSEKDQLDFSKAAASTIQKITTASPSRSDLRTNKTDPTLEQPEEFHLKVNLRDGQIIGTDFDGYEWGEAPLDLNDADTRTAFEKLMRAANFPILSNTLLSDEFEPPALIFIGNSKSMPRYLLIAFAFYNKLTHDYYFLSLTPEASIPFDSFVAFAATEKIVRFAEKSVLSYPSQYHFLDDDTLVLSPLLRSEIRVDEALIKQVANDIVNSFRIGAPTNPSIASQIAEVGIDPLTPPVEAAIAKYAEQELLQAQGGYASIIGEINQPVVLRAELQEAGAMSAAALKRFVSTVVGSVRANEFIAVRLQVPASYERRIRDLILLERTNKRDPVKIIPAGGDFIIHNEGFPQDFSFNDAKPALVISSQIASGQLPQLDPSQYVNQGGEVSPENLAEVFTAGLLWVSARLSKQTNEMISRDRDTANDFLYRLSSPAVLGSLAKISSWLASTRATASAA